MNKLETLIDWALPNHQEKLHEFLKTLQPKSYWITIKPYRKTRSREANAYYWCGVVAPICEYHGYDPSIQEHRDTIHEMLKKKFNSKVFEFKRRVFCFELGNGFEERPEILNYLEEKNFKPEVLNGKIALPLSLVAKIEDRFDYGFEDEAFDSVSLPDSTTKLDSTEHFNFIERIRDYYALEYDFYIPSPDSSDRAISEFDEMYNKL